MCITSYSHWKYYRMFARVAVDTRLFESGWDNVSGGGSPSLFT